MCSPRTFEDTGWCAGTCFAIGHAVSGPEGEQAGARSRGIRNGRNQERLGRGYFRQGFLGDSPRPKRNRALCFFPSPRVIEDTVYGYTPHQSGTRAIWDCVTAGRDGQRATLEPVCAGLSGGPWKGPLWPHWMPGEEQRSLPRGCGAVATMHQSGGLTTGIHPCTVHTHLVGGKSSFFGAGPGPASAALPRRIRCCTSPTS